jgi:hypothetical protein
LTFSRARLLDAVDAAPDLGLADQPAQDAALGLHGAAVDELGGADQGDLQGRHEDLAAHVAVAGRFEVAQQLLADQGGQAALARVRLGLGAGIDHGAAGAGPAALDRDPDIVLRAGPDTQVGGLDRRHAGERREGGENGNELTHDRKTTPPMAAI